MIFQTTPGIRQEWRDEGCAVHAALYESVRRNTDEIVTVESINKVIYPELVKAGIIRPDCYVNDWEELFGFFGLDVRYKGHHGSDRVCGDNEFQLLLWHYAPKDWWHFTNGNGFGFTTFDPWGISTTATRGQLHNTRLFEVVG